MSRHVLALFAASTLLSPLAGRAQGEPPPAAAQAPAAAPAPAAAAKAPAPAAEPVVPGQHRVLAGHRFEPSTLVDDPFTSASIGMDIGYLYGTARGPKLVFTPPSTITPVCCRDLPYAGILGEVDGSIRIADWIALRLGLATLTYSGVDGRSVLAVGSGVKTALRAQVNPGLQLGDSLRASLLLGVSSKPALDILVLSGIIDAYRQSGAVSGGDVLQVSNTITYDAGASVAWAIHRSLGFTGAVEYIAPRKTGPAAFASNGIQGAGELDFDVGGLTAAAPFGVSVAYRVIAPLNSDVFRTQQDARLGLFYSGRPGLTLRVELGGRRFNIRQDQLLSNMGTFDTIVRYDW